VDGAVCWGVGASGTLTLATSLWARAIAAGIAPATTTVSRREGSVKGAGRCCMRPVRIEHFTLRGCESAAVRVALPQEKPRFTDIGPSTTHLRLAPRGERRNVSIRSRRIAVTQSFARSLGPTTRHHIAGGMRIRRHP
jgi:hypothetical protein